MHTSMKTNKLFSDASTKASYAKKLSTWNKTKGDEFEILLPRNFACRVVKKEKVLVDKMVRGFENVYSKEKSTPITIYEMKSLPYEAPPPITPEYFKEKPSYVCF
jgi:hypothetical protein